MRRLPPSAEWRRSRRRFTSGAGQAAGAAAPEPQREEAPAGRRRPAARQVLLETYIWPPCEIKVENHMYEYCCQAVDSPILQREVLL